MFHNKLTLNARMRGNMRVGIVGFGGMGKWHSEIISEIGDLTVAGIYDIKE